MPEATNNKQEVVVDSGHVFSLLVSFLLTAMFSLVVDATPWEVVLVLCFPCLKKS